MLGLWRSLSAKLIRFTRVHRPRPLQPLKTTENPLLVPRKQASNSDPRVILYIPPILADAHTWPQHRPSKTWVPARCLNMRLKSQQHCGDVRSTLDAIQPDTPLLRASYDSQEYQVKIGGFQSQLHHLCFLLPTIPIQRPTSDTCVRLFQLSYRHDASHPKESEWV